MTWCARRSTGMRNGQDGAAIVIDDLASIDPWQPRGIEVRGRVETTGGARPSLRIYPERIVSWGIESHELGKRLSRRAA